MRRFSSRYLKQEITAPPGQDGEPGRFSIVRWHPEDALRLILATSCKVLKVHSPTSYADYAVAEVIQRTYAWDTIGSPSKPPIDSGSIAVVDGSKLSTFLCLETHS